MAIQVEVKNYAGTKETKTVIVNKTAGQYCQDLRSAGYTGLITKLEEALEAGFKVEIDQFMIEVKQI
ncbi:hypothetical protein D3C87_2020750 [compost metagenome]